MTRKTISERRMAGANKQIAELTNALGEARDYSSVLAATVRDNDGLIKHLKSSNAALRTKLSAAEQAAKASNDTITQQSQHIHEIATAASVTAENRDHFKKLSADYSRRADSFQALSLSERNRAADYQDRLLQSVRDARSWKRGFFLLVAITVIAQVVNYVAS